MDFSKFDQEIDQKVNAAVEEEKKNGGFDDVPKGHYVCDIDKMELGAVKKDGRPMFTMSLKIKDGNYKGRLLFFNRVIFGNNKSEKWTDAKAIASVLTILDKFGTSTVPVFQNYSQFADNVLDIYEELEGKVEVEIDYDADAFNPFTFTADDVYDI